VEDDLVLLAALFGQVSGLPLPPRYFVVLDRTHGFSVLYLLRSDGVEIFHLSHDDDDE
jgi:hypothetical protein